MSTKKNMNTNNIENDLDYFPIGLIIIEKENENLFRIKMVNSYARKLLDLPQNLDINLFKERLEDYKIWENNQIKEEVNLSKILFEEKHLINFNVGTFVSSISMINVKIKTLKNTIYMCIDNYSDERKNIKDNLIKSLKYQYIVTLYHELNNPLNALLAISGEKMRFDSTEIGNSRIFTKNPIINRKKTVRTKAYKKDHKISGGFISLNNSKDKIICNVPDEQPRARKKSLFENNNNNNSSEISSKINLLVKIIKIFIKNFILYLKTRADNLLTLQNEFNIQNETSDIMNAVEVSEYEKDLTKHKNVKLNLEYIFDLYFNKYYCLFKYKEIEC
jgi:hypothetical protein